MDEPLSNLDAKLRGHMRAELKHLQDDLGTTTIYVTHDQIEAMTLAHRVAVMNKGVVQQLGRPGEIYDDPANLFVAGFIGSPPMNFLEGRPRRWRLRLSRRTLPTTVAGSHRGVTAGLRPEDCSAAAPGEGRIQARVYALELMGDHTLVTCQLEGHDADVQVRQGRRPRHGRADRRHLRARLGLPLRRGERRAASRAARCAFLSPRRS